jgi:hypothetical protein
MLVLASNNDLYFAKPEFIQTKKHDELQSLNLTEMFDLDEEYDILKFDLLDCRTRILLYLKSRNSMNRLLYDHVLLIDLDFKVQHGAKIKSFGIDNFSTSATNENGEKVYTIFLTKDDWNIALYELSISDESFITKKIDVIINEKKEFESPPKAICFAYKKDRSQLILSSDKGDLYLYDIEEEMVNFKKQIQLKLKEKINIFKDKESYFKEYFDKLILSWSQEFLIGLSKFSEIHIFELEKDSLKLKKSIMPKSNINGISLTPNGRFLLTNGYFYESVQRFDLSDLDTDSFGDKCENYMKRLRDKTTEEIKDSADKEKTMYMKNVILRHGNIEQHIKNQEDIKFKMNQKVKRAQKDMDKKDIERQKQATEQPQ